METTLHGIEILKGIGEVTAEKLAAVGITYTEDLLYDEDSLVSSDLSGIADIAYSEVFNNYLPISKFLRVDGIEVDTAYELIDAGILNYNALAWAWTPWLIDILKIDETQLLKWQLEATKRENTGSVLIKAVNESDELIENLSVEFTNPFPKRSPHAAAWTTRESGKANCEFIAPGLQEFTAVCEGYSQKPGVVNVHKGEVSYILIRMSEGDHEQPAIDEAINGITFEVASSPILRPTSDEPPPSATNLLWVSGESRVSEVLLKKFGAELVCTSYQNFTVPEGSAIGNVIQKNEDDVWEVISNNWLEWRAGNMAGA